MFKSLRSIVIFTVVMGTIVMLLDEFYIPGTGDFTFYGMVILVLVLGVYDSLRKVFFQPK